VSFERPRVIPPSAAWSERTAILIAMLEVRLGDLAVRVDHIGSTAIPDMAAKDVLDIQVSVSSLQASVPVFDGPLGALGFQRSPYESDHIPVGRADDPAVWAKRLWLRRGHPEGDVNLHVRRDGSPNERLALLFRDWFRAHTDAVPAYSAFKVALAEISADTGTYADVKDPVVDLVITIAETWASSVGWQP
jgi:GrpB-like predicted nucleotidyltransferase (UPF0157 family)